MKVGVIMGSVSDYEVMTDAVATLEQFGVDFEKRVVSAHRNAHHRQCRHRSHHAGQVRRTARTGDDHADTARLGRLGILAQQIGRTVGVPVKSRALNGLDSLLSIVQMPAGVPVATTAINGSKNAALIAVSILALQDAELAARLEAFRAKQTADVLKAEL